MAPAPSNCCARSPKIFRQPDQVIKCPAPHSSRQKPALLTCLPTTCASAPAQRPCNKLRSLRKRSSSEHCRPKAPLCLQTGTARRLHSSSCARLALSVAGPRPASRRRSAAAASGHCMVHRPCSGVSSTVCHDAELTRLDSTSLAARTRPDLLVELAACHAQSPEEDAPPEEDGRPASHTETPSTPTTAQGRHALQPRS